MIRHIPSSDVISDIRCAWILHCVLITSSTISLMYHDCRWPQVLATLLCHVHVVCTHLAAMTMASWAWGVFKMHQYLYELNRWDRPAIQSFRLQQDCHTRFLFQKAIVYGQQGFVTWGSSSR